MASSANKLLSTAATSIMLAAANSFIPVSAAHAGSLDQWTSWVEVGGFVGSDTASRGELVGFAPLAQNADSLIFVEMRGKAFEQDQQEGNFALGYRQMLEHGWNAGVWAGIDVRRTPANTNFWQAAGGLELLHTNWDVRLNGYVPFNDENELTTSHGGTATLTGSNIAVTPFVSASQPTWK